MGALVKGWDYCRITLWQALTTFGQDRTEAISWPPKGDGMQNGFTLFSLSGRNMTIRTFRHDHAPAIQFGGGLSLASQHRIFPTASIREEITTGLGWPRADILYSMTIAEESFKC